MMPSASSNSSSSFYYSHYSNHLPPPSFYFGKLSSYFDQWQQQQQQQQQQVSSTCWSNSNDDERIPNNYNYHDETVFGLSYINSRSNNLNRSDEYNIYPSSWLVGCTKSGKICVWWTTTRLTTGSTGYDDGSKERRRIDDDDDDDGEDIRTSSNTKLSSQQYHEPVWSQKISNNTLYQCQFVSMTTSTTTTNSNNTNSWLIVSGDDGVLIFDWENHILPQVQNSFRNNFVPEEQNGYKNNEGKHRNITLGSTPPPPPKKKPKYRSTHVGINTETASTSSTTNTVVPIQRYSTFPSPMEIRPIEINDFVISSNDDGNSNNNNNSGPYYLYGAAGDSFCYKWDIQTQQLVTTYRQQQQKQNQKQESHGDYLQSVNHVPNTNLLLMGGINGILNIWDTKHDKLIDTIQVNQKLKESDNNNYNNYNNNTTVTISSSIARDENWWTIGGCCTTSCSSIVDGRNNGGGYLASIHGPTRSIISSVYTRETPQQLTYYSTTAYKNNKTTGQTNTNNILLSVANESFISHWYDPLQLQQSSPLLLNNNNQQQSRQRVWCTTPSGYAIATNTVNGQIAVGGVGSIVDIYDHRTQPCMKLTTRRS